MKKKLFNLFAICLCAIAFLASCGGPKDATKELEISKAEVFGDSADVVSIVDGTYTLVGVVPTDITQTLSIKIKLRLKRPIQDKDLHISGWNLEILDKNGTSLLDKLILKDSEDSKLLKFVTEGKEGEEKEFTFQYSIANGDLYKKIMNDAANINLKDVSFYKEQYYSSESSEVTDEETTDTDSNTDVESDDISSNNVDEILKTYSEYVDKYIKFMKKAANGDLSAMTEYASLLKKAQEFDEKLKEVKGDMTTAQMNKFLEIQKKMLSAMQEDTNN